MGIVGMAPVLPALPRIICRETVLMCIKYILETQKYVHKTLKYMLKNSKYLVQSPNFAHKYTVFNGKIVLYFNRLHLIGNLKRLKAPKYYFLLAGGKRENASGKSY